MDTGHIERTARLAASAFAWIVIMLGLVCAAALVCGLSYDILRAFGLLSS